MEQPHDNPVLEIFAKFGQPKVIADATGFAIQTVCDWRIKGQPEIPPWRRAAVLDAARRMKIDLSTDALAYLSSDIRSRKIAA